MLTALGHSVEEELMEVGTRGLCRLLKVPTSVFYPLHGESQTRAKSICQQCDMRERCLALALTLKDDHGIWGGLNVRERNRLKGRRR